MQATGVRRDPPSEVKRNKQASRHSCLLGRVGARAVRKGSLTMKIGEGENGRALSRGIFGIFLWDSARKDGLK